MISAVKMLLPSGWLPDRRLVDLRALFIDHYDTSILILADDVERDVMRDQVGGLSRITLGRAIKPDGIFEPKTIGDIKMKNGH